jgi:hypothetical protein
MSLLSFLNRRNRLRQKPERYRFRPHLEVLEGRALPSALVVHNTNDAGPGSLRQAIRDAASGDAILFDPELAGKTVGLTSGELQITKSLEILNFPDFRGTRVASTVVISGSDAFRVFDILSSTATVGLLGLTITGGFIPRPHSPEDLDPVDGGGIYNRGTLAVSHCTVFGNRAWGSGGGIESVGTLWVSHSGISSNVAGGEGGGIDGKHVTITNSTLAKNSALEGGGFSGGGTIRQSIVSHNAAADGGGIFMWSDTAVSDSTLSDNSANGGDGGGIFNFGGTLTISNSTLSGNSATHRTLRYGIAGGDGGGIYFSADGGDGTLINCRLLGNSASQAGGGIYNAGGNGHALTVSHCTLSGNVAQDQGGGIYNDGTLNVGHCEIRSNGAIEGGGIYNGVGGLLYVFDHSTICTNFSILGPHDIFKEDGADLFNLGHFTDDGSNTICIIAP